MRKITFFLFSVFFMSFLNHASANCVPVEKDLIGTGVVYINGVMTKYDDGFKAAYRIKNLRLSNQIDPQGVSFSFVHNWNDAFFVNDWLEAGAQKFNQEFWKKYGLKSAYDAFTKFILVKTINILSEDEPVRKAIIEITASSMKKSTNLVRNVKQLVSCYKEVLKADKKLYALSHSQGGLFVNDALDVLVSEQEFRINRVSTYQVATPASKMNKGFCWNSGKYQYDFATGILGVLPNINVDLFESDFANHGILETYLNPKNVEMFNIIKSGIVNTSPSNCLEACFEVKLNGNNALLDPSCSLGLAHKHKWEFPTLDLDDVKDCGMPLTQSASVYGTHTFKLNLWNTAGRKETVSKTISVSTGDKSFENFKSIIPKFFKSKNTYEGLIANFTATPIVNSVWLDASTTISENYILKYEWFTPGSPGQDASITCFPDASTYYSRPGQYSITLKVTDNLGASDTITKTVSVAGTGDK